PSAMVLASGSVPSPTASVQNTVNVTDGPFLAASTTYWLYLYAMNGGSFGTNSYYAFQSLGNSNSSALTNTWNTLNGGDSWIGIQSNYDPRFEITTSQISAKNKLSQSFQVAGTQTV